MMNNPYELHVSGKVKPTYREDYMLPKETFVNACLRLQSKIAEGDNDSKVALRELLRSPSKFESKKVGQLKE